jgi:hypothetical protein
MKDHLNKQRWIHVGLFITLLLNFAISYQSVGAFSPLRSISEKTQTGQSKIFNLAIAHKSQTSFSRGGCESNPHNSVLPFAPIQNWQLYEDSSYAFTFDFPGDWRSDTTIEQSIPYHDSEAIIKRQSLLGMGGLIEIDVWLSQGYDLHNWLIWYAETRNPLPLKRFEAKISGREAVIFLEQGGTTDLLTTFLSDGQYIFRIWHTITNSSRGDAYWKILESWEFQNRTEGITEIPRSVRELVEKTRSISSISGDLRTSSCCGHYSGGNPFPCCNDQGNCVWWVFYKFGWVPFRGDAGTWWGQVPDYPRWWRRSSPLSGRPNIAWWSKIDQPDYGHVAYLASYSGGGTVNITEQSWCSSCYNSRSISTTTPTGWIMERWP